MIFSAMSCIIVIHLQLKSRQTLHQGLSEPEFYGDLLYKFKKIVGKVDFCDQFRKIIVRYKRIGYNINIMRQSACLVGSLLFLLSVFILWFIYYVSDIFCKF